MASNYIWSIKAPYSFFVASHKGFYQKGNPKHENGMAEWVSYSVKTKVKRRSMIKVSAIRVALFFLGIPLWDSVTAKQPVINGQKAREL